MYTPLVDAVPDAQPWQTQRQLPRWLATLKSAQLEPAGPWQKDQRLILTFDNPLPESIMELIPDPFGKKFQPLVAVDGHPKYNGVWRVVACEDVAGTRLACHVPPYKETEYDSGASFGVHFDVNAEAGQNLCFSSLQGKHELAAASRPPRVFLAPPLNFHVRCTLNHVDDIDLVAQKFRADVFVEFRLRQISDQPEEELVERLLLKAYGFCQSMVELMGIVEETSKEQWTTLTSSGTDPSKYDFCIKLRFRGVFAEEYELQLFPFDVQPLHVCVTLNIPNVRAVLSNNLEFPSVMRFTNFQLAAVFDVIYKDHMDVLVTCSDPSESSAEYRYPRCSFYLTLARRPGYYLTNVVLPMSAITGLTAISAGAVEIDGSRLSTGDRLSVSLTLMLTAVAYKFIVATMLPQISYLTLLDAYLLCCFALIILVCIENVAFPALAYDRSGDVPVEMVNEWLIFCLYIGAFVLLHVVGGVYLYRLVSSRQKEWDEKYAADKLRRESQRDIHLQRQASLRELQISERLRRVESQTRLHAA